jgi:disulfide bond formation protein DsbB
MKLKLSKEAISQIVLLFCCGALVGAWVAEYVFGFQACVLCLYQRYLYIAAIIISSIGLFFLRGRFKDLFSVLTALVLLSNAGTAAYQVAIENKWVELPKLCAAPIVDESFEAFKAMITAKPHVSCDKVEWSLFDISMAGYNALLALMLSILSFIGVFANDHKKKKFTRR